MGLPCIHSDAAARWTTDAGKAAAALESRYEDIASDCGVKQLCELVSDPRVQAFFAAIDLVWKGNSTAGDRLLEVIQERIIDDVPLTDGRVDEVFWNLAEAD